MAGIESQYIVSYKLVIVTMGLGSPIKLLQPLLICHDLGSSCQGHPRSNLMVGIESPHMVSY